VRRSIIKGGAWIQAVRYCRPGRRDYSRYKDDCKGFRTVKRKPIEKDPEEESKRMLTGGSWGITPGHCRPANRVLFSPSLNDGFVGFQTVRRVPKGEEDEDDNLWVLTLDDGEDDWEIRP